MNQREKALFLVVAVMVAGFVGYVALDRLWLTPAQRLKQQITELIRKNNDLAAENKQEAMYNARLRHLHSRTFGSEELRVSEQVRARVAELIDLAGISRERLSFQPTMGARVQHTYKEVGWIINARGKLDSIIDLLFLLTYEPHLHRLDNITLAPVARSGDVDMTVKFVTLVLEAKPSTGGATTQPAATQPAGDLADPRRQVYSMIAARDLFRPYIRRQPAPPQHVAQGEQPAPPVDPSGRYRVVGLPTWGGRADVFIRDEASNETLVYKLGDTLGDGKIVMVDYRPMPKPGSPEIISTSRVILRVAQAFYAVELGGSLAERHELAAQELPESLRKSTQPTEAPGSPIAN